MGRTINSVITSPFIEIEETNISKSELVTLSDRLSYAIRSAGVTQSELARRIGVKPQVIQYLCNNRSIHATRFASAISAELDINLEWLLSGKGNMRLEKTTAVSNQPQKIPLLKWSQITHWLTFNTLNMNEHAEWIVADNGMSDASYALRVFDDAMSPRFEEGTILLIDPQIEAKHKDFVVVYLKEDNRVVFRQLLIDGNDKYLVPLHPIYKKILLNDNDTFLGVMKQARFNYH